MVQTSTDRISSLPSSNTFAVGQKAPSVFTKEQRLLSSQVLANLNKTDLSRTSNSSTVQRPVYIGSMTIKSSLHNPLVSNNMIAIKPISQDAANRVSTMTTATITAPIKSTSFFEPVLKVARNAWASIMGMFAGFNLFKIGEGVASRAANSVAELTQQLEGGIAKGLIPATARA